MVLARRALLDRWSERDVDCPTPVVAVVVGLNKFWEVRSHRREGERDTLVRQLWSEIRRRSLDTWSPGGSKSDESIPVLTLSRSTLTRTLTVTRTLSSSPTVTLTHTLTPTLARTPTHVHS